MLTVILCLDTHSDSDVSFRDQLLSYHHVQTFTKSDDCIDYIRSHLIQNLFLVISGSLVENVIVQVIQCANIKQIFILSVSIASHLQLALDHSERLLIFDQTDGLLERFWNEMAQHFREEAQECIQHAEELKERANQFKQPSCG